MLIQFAALGAVLNQYLGTEPYVVGRLHAGFFNKGFAGFHHVLDLQVNDRADDEIAAAFVGQRPMLFFDGAGDAAPQLDVFGKLLFRQQPGVQAVVEVVAVIGDLVGEVGDLRFEGGIFLRRTPRVCWDDRRRCSASRGLRASPTKD